MAGIKDVDKIQKQITDVQKDIKTTLTKYKSATGLKKQDHIQKLKDLQEKKKKLEKKMDDVVSKLHSDVEFDLEESVVSGEAMRRMQRFMTTSDVKNLKSALNGIYSNLVLEEGFEPEEVIELVMKYVKSIIV